MFESSTYIPAPIPRTSTMALFKLAQGEPLNYRLPTSELLGIPIAVLEWYPENNVKVDLLQTWSLITGSNRRLAHAQLFRMPLRKSEFFVRLLAVGKQDAFLEMDHGEARFIYGLTVLLRRIVYPNLLRKSLYKDGGGTGFPKGHRKVPGSKTHATMPKHLVGINLVVGRLEDGFVPTNQELGFVGYNLPAITAVGLFGFSLNPNGESFQKYILPPQARSTVAKLRDRSPGIEFLSHIQWLADNELLPRLLKNEFTQSFSAEATLRAAFFCFVKEYIGEPMVRGAPLEANDTESTDEFMVRHLAVEASGERNDLFVEPASMFAVPSHAATAKAPSDQFIVVATEYFLHGSPLTARFMQHGLERVVAHAVSSRDVDPDLDEKTMTYLEFLFEFLSRVEHEERVYDRIGEGSLMENVTQDHFFSSDASLAITEAYLQMLPIIGDLRIGTRSLPRINEETHRLEAPKESRILELRKEERRRKERSHARDLQVRKEIVRSFR